MKISLQTFYDKFCNKDYRFGLYVPKDLMDYINSSRFNSINNGKEWENIDVEIPDNIFDVVEANKQADLEHERLYHTISQYRLDGMDIEKTDIDKAIECYKKSIDLGEGTNMFYAYANSYKRIIVLFRKTKNYKDEILYCSKFLEHDLSDCERAKFSERLSKLKNKYGELE